MLSRRPHCPVRGPLLRRMLALLVLGLGSTGCGITKYGGRNLIEAPLNTRDRNAECIRDRHLADAAWAEIAKAQPEQVVSVHYVNGFKDGYVDYLYYGGTGAPPVMPPWHYRQAVYESPEGQQAVHDWFAGFHHGAGAAQESGYRQFVVVPLALRADPSVRQRSSDAPSQSPASESPEAGQVLPPPRPVPPVPENAEKSDPSSP